MIAQKPLKNIRVLDASRVLAGPFCTLTLADLGAEVIKIELPGSGDDSRGYPPMIPGSNDSGYFWRANRGKESLTLDLRTEEGGAVFLDLARHSDVVVENFSAGTMERYGIGYPTLKAVNPLIILCSISGFGQTGPMAGARAYDIVAQALSGMMSITGPAGGEPTRCGVSIGDLTAALYGVIAILSALRVRDISRQGQHLDIAMLDCQVALLEDALSRFSLTGEIPRPIGSRHPSITPFQQFHAADGYFVIGVGSASMWERFCATIGRPDLTKEPRFANNEARTANQPELERLLNEHFRTKARSHWLGILEQANVPCAPVANLEEVTHNRHLIARNMILHADHPGCADLIVPGSPLKSAGEDVVPNTRAPRLGEHTTRILSELLGYDEKRLTQLRERGII